MEQSKHKSKTKKNIFLRILRRLTYSKKSPPPVPIIDYEVRRNSASNQLNAEPDYSNRLIIQHEKMKKQESNKDGKPVNSFSMAVSRNKDKADPIYGNRLIFQHEKMKKQESSKDGKPVNSFSMAESRSKNKAASVFVNQQSAQKQTEINEKEVCSIWGSDAAALRKNKGIPLKNKIGELTALDKQSVTHKKNDKCSNKIETEQDTLHYAELSFNQMKTAQIESKRNQTKEPTHYATIDFSKKYGSQTSHRVNKKRKVQNTRSVERT